MSNKALKSQDPSSVWHYFDEIFENGQKFGRCKFKTPPCNEKIKCPKSSTTAMWKHAEIHNIFQLKTKPDEVKDGKGLKVII